MSVRLLRVLFIASVALAGSASAPAQDFGNPDRAREIRALTPAELQPQDLRFWNDDRFRREFMASYIPATTIEPTLSENDRERVQDILALISDQAFEEAIEQIRRRRTLTSTAVYDYLLGNIHFQNDRLDLAGEAYVEATRKFPNYRRAWKNLGLIRVKQQDFARALPALTKVVELGGSDATTFGTIGYCHGALEDPVAAESAYRMAIMLDGSSLDWKMGLARSLFMQQRFADAASLVGRLIERDPTDARMWILQANAFIGLGEPLRAAENYEMIERLDASTVETLSMLGDIYVNEGLFTSAVATYERAMEMDLDGRPERALRAARVMVAQGAYDETAELVDGIEALYGYTLEPVDQTELLRVKARIAVAEGAGEEQVRILQEIIRIDPLDGDALLLLGQHFYRADEPERAIFHFERAANLPTVAADAKVWHAQVLVSRQKYAEALPLIRQAQALRPRESVRAFLEQIERFAGRG